MEKINCNSIENQNKVLKNIKFLNGSLRISTNKHGIIEVREIYEIDNDFKYYNLHIRSPVRGAITHDVLNKVPNIKIPLIDMTITSLNSTIESLTKIKNELTEYIELEKKYMLKSDKNRKQKNQRNKEIRFRKQRSLDYKRENL